MKDEFRERLARLQRGISDATPGSFEDDGRWRASVALVQALVEVPYEYPLKQLHEWRNETAPPP